MLKVGASKSLVLVFLCYYAFFLEVQRGNKFPDVLPSLKFRFTSGFAICCQIPFAFMEL